MSYNILFVESAPTLYGSSMSLLGLLEGLDRKKFMPHVAVHSENPLVQEVESQGIPVQPLRLRDDLQHDNKSAKLNNLTIKNGIFLKFAKALMPTYIADVSRHMRDIYVYSDVIRVLQQYISRNNIDLVHLNNQPSTNRFAYLAVQDTPILQHIRIAPLTAQRRSQKLVRTAEAVVCVSEFVASSARQDLLVEPKNIHVIPNSVQTRFFECKRSGSFRDQLGIGADDLIFAQIGRLERWKGQDLFLEAFATACSNLACAHASVHAILVGSNVGDVEYERFLRNTVSKHRLEKHVHFMGYTRDVPSMLADVDVLVHFTRGTEGFGRVVVESMAAGCVPVVSNNGPLPELVKDGVNGFVTKDVHGLSQRIFQVTSNPSLLIPLKRGAREMAETYRSVTVADRLGRVYESVLRQRLGSLQW